MVKVQIHEFDPIIYPFKLWVVISNNLPEIESNFIEGSTSNPIDLNNIENHADAFVLDGYLIHKETRKNGFLVVFRNKVACTVPVMAHEATHAARFIWDHLGEENTGTEADAYLVEWIVDCIYQVKTNKFK